MIWEAIGWLGNACFFSRMFLQWWLSERRGESVVPRGFWVLSLAGALLAGAYSIHESTWILTAGFSVTSLLYVRNLWLSGGDGERRGVPVVAASAAGLGAAAVLILAALTKADSGDMSLAWVVVAACGQAVWSTRFVVQWWLAERTGRSELPPLFWWWSLVGNSVLLAYTLALGNPVFIAGLLLGPFVQVRNLMLAYRRREEPPASARAGHA